MDPRCCRDTKELMQFRQITSEKLDNLQRDTDLIIEDTDMSLESKTGEINNLIPTIWQKFVEEEFSDNVSEQFTTLIDHFEGKVTTHLQKMHNDILKGSERVLNKTRGNYSEGLLTPILQEAVTILRESRNKNVEVLNNREEFNRCLIPVL